MPQAADRRVGHRAVHIGVKLALIRSQANAVLRTQVDHHLVLANSTDTTRHTLPARFVLKELGNTGAHVGQVSGRVEHHDDARAKRRASSPRVFERERHIERSGCHE